MNGGILLLFNCRQIYREMTEITHKGLKMNYQLQPVEILRKKPTVCIISNLNADFFFF